MSKQERDGDRVDIVSEAVLDDVPQREDGRVSGGDVAARAVIGDQVEHHVHLGEIWVPRQVEVSWHKLTSPTLEQNSQDTHWKQYLHSVLCRNFDDILRLIKNGQVTDGDLHCYINFLHIVTEVVLENLGKH